MRNTKAEPRNLPPAVSGAQPLLGHAVEFARQPERLLERGSRETGGIFRLQLPTKPTVVLVGAERNKFFFSETDKQLSIDVAYSFFTRMLDPSFYYFAGPAEYKRQREILLPRFQGRQLADYLAVMQRETASFTDVLGDHGEFDLTTEFGPLVMRIAANCFLGEDFGNDLTNDFFEEFRKFSEGMDPLFPGWLPLPHLIRSRRARDRLRIALGKTIEERRRRPLESPDFLQTLVGAHYADGEPVPDLVLVNMILLLTWAGHETTTGHLAWALVDLLKNPQELDKVLTEQERLPAFGDPLALADLGGLPYLENCLHETERLHPVAYILARSAAVDIELEGYHIPAGTMVLTSPWVTHRLPGEHAEPSEFRPDRFTQGRSGREERRQLIGFGGGMHRCLGVHFAYLEMKIILTRLLQNYHFELVDENPQPITGMNTKWPSGPCRVRYKQR